MLTTLQRIYALGTLISCTVSLAQSPTPNTSEHTTLLAALHPGSSMEQIVRGDLDKDGVADIAYLVRWPDAGEYAIGTLKGTAGNSLVHWTHTARLQVDQRPPEVAIRDGSLYVTYMKNGTSWGNWRTLQFSNRKERLVLIGEENYFRTPRWDFEPGPVRSETASTNYLNCHEIKSSTEGKKRTEAKSKMQDCKLSSLEELE